MRLGTLWPRLVFPAPRSLTRCPSTDLLGAGGRGDGANEWFGSNSPSGSSSADSSLQRGLLGWSVVPANWGFKTYLRPQYRHVKFYDMWWHVHDFIDCGLHGTWWLLPHDFKRLWPPWHVLPCASCLQEIVAIMACGGCCLMTSIDCGLHGMWWPLPHGIMVCAQCLADFMPCHLKIETESN